MTTLAVDPTDATRLYAGTPSAGIFKSTDAGNTWTASSNGLTTYEQWFGITSVAIDPETPSTLYASTSASSLFKSTDSGATWARTGDGLPGVFPVLELLVSPDNTATLYAGTRGGASLYKSTDAGKTWQRTAGGFPWEVTVAALAIDPSNPSIVYAGTGWGPPDVPGLGIWKSTDGGGTWAPASAGLPQAPWYPDIVDLAVDGSAPNTLYAVTDWAGIFRSTNGGMSWTYSDAGPQGAGAASVRVTPTTPSTIYVGTGGGVLKSTDAGSSWAAASNGLNGESARVLALAASAPTTLYVGGMSGPFRSTDAAGSWVAANGDLKAQDIGALAISRTGTVFAGLRQGVFKSTDAGETWARSSAGLPALAVRSLATDPTARGTLYAGLQANGVFKSTDSGDTWLPANTGLDGGVGALVIDPANPNVLYAEAAGWAFKSTNAGATWSLASVGLPQPVTALAIDPSDPQTLYAGTYVGGVYKSTDAGAHWAATGWSGGVSALAIGPGSPSTLYAAVSTPQGSRVAKSTDAGATWSLTSLPPAGISTLVVDPGRPGTLYAGAQYHSPGIYRTTDAGSSWASVHRGLAFRTVAALSLDPSSGTLFAGLEGGSVWQATTPPAFVRGDLNGDGQPDLLFRNLVNGTQHKAWLMNGVNRMSEAVVAPEAPGADWLFRGVDDFDSDGMNDLVSWNPATGQVEFWLMNGSSRVGASVPLRVGPLPDPGWELAAVGDFSHDQRPDLVWRDPTSQQIEIWTLWRLGRGSTIIPTPSQAVDGNWAIVAALDYNHDGNTDFLWYNSTSGKIVTWYMDASVVRTSGQFTSPANAGDSNWKVVASADFSGAAGPGTPPLGSPDIVWRNETSGNQVVWHMDFASTRVHGEFTSPAANTPALDWTVVGPR